MIKKIILIVCLFCLVGCTSNINDMSYEEIIEMNLNDNNLSNVNSIGYKYYLPINFSVYKDDTYNQTLLSDNNLYYMHVDVVSYHYKKAISTEHNYNDYKYYAFNKNGKDGYLKITKNNDNFFVELCYNYAIIEVEVEESELRYAVSRSISILNSIKYNDLVIEKYINDNNLETSETIYKIPEPKNKNEGKNILEYIEEYEYKDE